MEQRRESMPPAPTIAPPQRSPTAAFLAGFRAAWRSVMAYVVMGTYIGIAALAHDFGFSLWWMSASTLLIWAGPAQVILVSALGTGASSIETALAVCLSSVRLLPMVISLLPLIRQPRTRHRDLILPAHLTAVSMWIEAMRLLPALPRESRIAFSNGLGLGFMLAALVGGCLGYYLATSLPPLLSAALLFLTPMSFLISTTRNCRLLSDWLALAFGLVLGPVLAAWHVGLDLLWTGIVVGTVAYGVDRVRRKRP
jgi:predicted branched-subunit amino acid permease